MAKYEVIIARSAKKQLRDILLPWKVRIQKAIELLEEDPFLGEKMRGEFQGTYKIHVWPYRVFYNVQQKARRIEVTGVRHRGATRYR